MRPPRDVRIDRIDTDGNGIGHDDRGLEWTIRAAPPGAVVRSVGRPRKGYRVGVVAPAADAVPPPCPAFGLCGGCVWQEMPLDRQRAEKHAAVARLLDELGGVDHGILGEPAGYGWRNKVEFTFGVDRFLPEDARDAPRAGRWAGFHPPGRFDRVVDLPGCPLMDPRMDEVYARVRADVLASGFPFWDPRAHTGFFRHLGLRAGEEGVLVAVYTSSAGEEESAWLASRAPTWGAHGVVWFVAEQRADAALGRLHAVLHGSPTVTAHLGPLAVRLSPSAFFQVNTAAAARMVAVVGEWLGRGGVLWDLYCGTGTLGLACAGGFDRVHGIEQNAAAVADARANAAANGVDAEFHAGEVEKLVHTLPRPDAVLVDPPRIGLHPDARAVVEALDARVLVYVACRPSSLLRDGRALVAAGWRLTDRVAVDLFPQTAHVEVVSRWVRLGA